jgi:uncharacterized protein DUF397
MSLTAWRKSSFSGGSGTDCVEVAWRRSSFSGTSGSDCVEVAWPNRATTEVAVRDSKNTTGPMLTLPHAAWRRFLTTC